MTVKLNQPKYSITDEQQARLINASDLGDKIAYEFKSNLEKVIGKIKDQDDKVEDSFGYVLKGLVSTIHYQIKNRNKWNAGIDSKLKNLERMDKEEINRVNTQQMWDNKYTILLLRNSMNLSNWRYIHYTQNILALLGYHMLQVILLHQMFQ